MYLFDFEYIFPAINPGQHHRLPHAVWQCESDGDRRARDRGDDGEHAGGGGVLQGDGEEGMNALRFC